MHFLESPVVAFFLIILIGFGLGSIPFGFILSKFFLGIDPRKIGSGNIGATNVLRTGHKYLAISTLFLDAIKGVLAVLIARKVSSFEIGPYLAGFSAIMGHVYTPWLGFKGGKGASTAAGALFALSWPVGLCTLLTWLFTITTTRYSSVATLLGAIAMPISAAYLGEYYLTGWCVLVAFIVALKHKENIHRLIQGRELRIGSGKTKN